MATWIRCINVHLNPDLTLMSSEKIPQTSDIDIAKVDSVYAIELISHDAVMVSPRLIRSCLQKYSHHSSILLNMAWGSTEPNWTLFSTPVRMNLCVSNNSSVLSCFVPLSYSRTTMSIAFIVEDMAAAFRNCSRVWTSGLPSPILAGPSSLCARPKGKLYPCV